MKKKVLAIAGIIGALAITITPIAIYAAGTNVGVISVQNGGTEVIHIIGEDINQLMTWGEELNDDVDDMNDHANLIEQRVQQLQTEAATLNNLVP